MTHYVIIGAGVAGLTSARYLKQVDIPFTIFERESDLGGQWWIEHPNSAVCHSTRLISSKKMSHFRDYPMPDHFPDYPHHVQMCEYLHHFARDMGLLDHIRFNTAVERVERGDDGGWDITLSDGQTLRGQGVIIANGHLWDPKYPDFPGDFDGDILHSKFYKTSEVLRGKRVLVVGAGNSGCDIAVEAATHAEAAFHSTRRGYHFIPKYIFGKPADQFNALADRLRLPAWLQSRINAALLRFYWGDLTRYGLQKPKHLLLQAHPLVNERLIDRLRHGDIIAKPDVVRLDGNQVAFVDGSSETIDLIIYATGFKVTIPFIDAEHLNWGASGPDLYLHAFHPHYDDLFLTGLLQPNSGIFHLNDGQGQLIAQFIHAQAHHPASAQAFRRQKSGPQPNLRGGIKHLDTARHAYEINHLAYEHQLRKNLRLFM
jgi:cation diffusion facilitator CzcD-associated flavoprotein CzcO